MAFELAKGRAAFFRKQPTGNNQPIMTGKVVIPVDAKAGDTVYVTLWDGNDSNVDYLSGTAKVASQ